MQLNNFSSSGCHSTILIFCRGVGDNALFLTFLRNKRVSKKETQICSELTISGILCV